MSIYESNGWFVPLPLSAKEMAVMASTIYDEKVDDETTLASTATSTSSGRCGKKKENNNMGSKMKGGKVWSNRNYGQDKKRQRKNAARAFLEARIRQLESCLKNEHGRDFDAAVGGDDDSPSSSDESEEEEDLDGDEYDHENGY